MAGMGFFYYTGVPITFEEYVMVFGKDIMWTYGKNITKENTAGQYWS